MTEKAPFTAGSRHKVTFPTIVENQLSVSLFGKLVKESPIDTRGSGLEHPSGSSEPLELGQVFGYLQNHQCVRLPRPMLVALPKPVGPADGCGWDPNEYLVWRVPADWLALHVSTRTAPIAHLLASADADQLTAGQCLTITSACVRAVTHSTLPLDPSQSLQVYGVNSAEQAATVRSLIVGDGDIGVPHYGFKIDSNSLKDLSSGWTVGQLSDRIQSAAIPV